METWPRIRSLFRNLRHRDRAERELDAELEAYVRLVEDEHLARGLTPAEARRAARVELGGLDQVKEQVRDVRAGVLLEQCVQDVQYGLRSFARSRGFSAVALVTLALGIGANTAIFSVIDAVLLRPLPVAEPDRLVTLQRGEEASATAFSYPQFAALAGQRAAFDGLFAWATGNRLWFRAGGDLERTAAQLVTGTYFDVLGVRAQLGRTFLPDEDLAGGVQPVAVISDAFWRRRFGADAGVAGRIVSMNGHAFTIVGVAPRGFTGLDPSSPPDFWLPLAALQILEPGWDFRAPQEIWLRVTGRLRTGATLAAAQAVLAAVEPPASRTPPRLISAGSSLTDPAARASSVRLAAVLMGGVSCVLLIACANLANLLVARSAARRREIGVRLAIGASRGRVARQLVTESVLLAGFGGLAGLAVAHWTIDLLVALAPASAVPPGVTVSLDARVVAFALGLSIATGLVFGAWPAWQASRLDVFEAVKGGSSRESRGSARAGRRALVVAQVAISVVLLVGAALFLRTFAAATGVAPGYDVDRILLVGVDFSAPGLAPESRRALAQRARAAVAAIPGVEAASLGQIVPFSGASIGRPVVEAGHVGRADSELTVPYSVVSADYFRTLGVPLRGRDFTAQDDGAAPRVIIVNETLARRLWPGQMAVGRRLRLPLREPGPVYEVVGVVQDSKYVSLTEAQHPFMYLPLTQEFRPRATLHVRVASGPPASLAPQVRAALREVEAALPAFGAQSLDDYVARSLERERLLAWLLTLFGALALLIAAVGIYGILAYTVASRTKELGLRLALGARPADVVRLVSAEGAGLVGAGLVIGAGAAGLLSRLVEAWLFGVTATDPVAFGGALAILACAAIAATWIPVRRAIRVDPLLALRVD